MRTLLIGFLVFFISGIGFTQSKIDSLTNELRKTSIADTSRIEVLLSLAKAYQYSDFEKSKGYAEEAIQLAESKDLKKDRAEAYQTIGALYTTSGDYTTALKYDNMALQLNLAFKDSTAIARNYNGIGNDYYDLGEYDEAYHFFTQSYKMARAIKDSLRMIVALHNVGRVFKELGQYDRAQNYFKVSQAMSERTGDAEGLPYTLSEIGDVQLRKGDYDSALISLTNTLKLTREQNILALEPRALNRLATIYLHKKDYNNALAYYDTTRNLHVKTNNQFGIAEVELGRGSVLMAQGNYDEAIKNISSSLEIAQKSNARILEKECYGQLSRIWELKGDYKKSLEFYKKHTELQDTLFSHDMQEKLFRDQIRFETEDKDSLIAALSRDKDEKEDQLKRQEFIRNILVVVMALSVILLATVYRSGQRRREINMLLLKHQEETEKRSEELERLNQVKDKFFSIISHDLRSPINALAGLLDLLDKGAVKPEEFPIHIRELKTRFNHTRTLLNNLLDWTLLQMDKLNLHATKIDIQKIVDENIQLLGAVQTKQIQMINNVQSPTIAFADSNTVNLVIRNLMTNAIKFTNDGGSVVIASQEKDNECIISVTDNGIGMNHDVLRILFDKTAPYTTRGTANEKGTGLGLILCKEFVEKNGGRIWVESEVGKGSTFYFTLPKG
ncbi:tetratricopeptide repeat-containing sensor histidine kinase [Chryseosolibacter indicus]|uniref:histidine kinase n=1 Tax=Chryseosolibacter indicus TaxID=2782351 RepID=A0ABS5VRT2_9BACT|nr:tetratricopeptide repeat protein [Chryseosolibacter indicus]